MGTEPGVRRCRCGTRLARDNRGPLCHACVQAARDLHARPPAVPAEFWRHPTMQAALAARDMGAVILAFRKHPFHGRDIAQRVVAAWGGITQTRLSHIENGEEIDSLKKLMRWAHVLRIPHDLLWFRMPGAPEPSDAPRGPQHADHLGSSVRHDPPSRPKTVVVPALINGRSVLLSLDPGTVSDSELGTLLGEAELVADPRGVTGVTADERGDMSPLKRRTFLGNSVAASVLPLLDAATAERIQAALVDPRRYLDGSVVNLLAGRLAAFKEDDRWLGSLETLPKVLALIDAVKTPAREVERPVRLALLRLGADAAEFAGWLYRDLGDHAAALYWHDRAVEWAQGAEDVSMQGYVLLRKAQLAYDQRDPVGMLTLSQAAQSASFDLPKRVKAEAVQQEARADAMLGASIDAVERKLDLARRMLDEAEARPDDRGLGAHYGPTLLTMQAAVCKTEAGRPRHAVALYERTLNEEDFSPRDYGFFLSWKAASLAFAGEPDEAAAVGIASAKRASDVESQRTKRELERVVKTLEPWKNRPGVRQLRAAVEVE